MPRKQVSKEYTNEEASDLLAQSLRRQIIAPNIHAYQPHPKQLQFHTSPKKRRLYIGGNRSGKTTGGICEDLWWVTKTHPFLSINEKWPEAIRGRVVGVDFPNGINKIILPQFAQWVQPLVLRSKNWESAYDKQARTLHFADGGFIEFMSYDQDLDKFAGTSRHFIHFDEEPPEDIYKECTARLIDTGGSAWITMTPVEGMTWIYDKLYLPVVEPENVPSNADLDIEFVNATTDVVTVSMLDNPHITPTEAQLYLSTLDNADERKAREHGQFIQIGGLVYKSFDEKRHVFLLTSAVLSACRNWVLVASMDHGLQNPTAWLWHLVGPQGEVLTIEEYYQNERSVRDHALKVLEVNQRLGRTPEYYVGDPSVNKRDAITMTSIAEEYSKYGINILPGVNDVKPGIIRVTGYLQDLPGSNPPAPAWRIASECTNLLWEMKRYRWKTFINSKLSRSNNSPDLPKAKDDHALDAARYFFMSRPDLRSDSPIPTKMPERGIPDTSTFNYTRAGQEFREARRGDFSIPNPTQWEVNEWGGEW